MHVLWFCIACGAAECQLAAAAVLYSGVRWCMGKIASLGATIATRISSGSYMALAGVSRSQLFEVVFLQTFHGLLLV
jgi:hypothetical protein